MDEPTYIDGDPEEIEFVVTDPDHQSDRRNHGKIDVNRLEVNTRNAILDLMNEVSMESGILKMQVTFDFEPDQPPTVHVITAPTDEAIDRWLS